MEAIVSSCQPRVGMSWPSSRFGRHREAPQRCLRGRIGGWRASASAAGAMPNIETAGADKLAKSASQK